MVARRSVRKRTAEVIIAINAMTGETIGRIGNLSVDGMMLISQKIGRSVRSRSRHASLEVVPFPASRQEIAVQRNAA